MHPAVEEGWRRLRADYHRALRAASADEDNWLSDLYTRDRARTYAHVHIPYKTALLEGLRVKVAYLLKLKEIMMHDLEACS